MEFGKMMDLINIAPGKRPAVIKRLKTEQKNMMRAKLPVLTREEILRYRLPPHEALLRSISQDGFHSTCEYIRQLITYQEYVRKLHGPDTSVWSKPRLLERMDILNQLKEGLYKAERANRAENTGVELTELLRLAVRFAFGDQNWWWLGHQLLDQALTISRVYMKDGGMHHAIARYAYGKFLLESSNQTNNYMEAALEHLNVARSMSVGTSWSARFIFPTYQSIMFTEVSILIHQILLKQAKNCMKKDPHLAIKLSILAEKAALDGCHFSGQTEAQIVKGECEQLIYDTSSAITSFRKALTIQNSHETPKWRAETLSHLAIAYLKHGDLTSALQKLNELKEYALEHDLKFYLAQAYKYLGEYYLREGTPQNSTPLLRKALKLFHEENHIPESENARNYAAISIGIELMNPYIQLIVNCVSTNPNYEYLMKTLLAWKDSRQNFWSYADFEVSFNDINDTMDEDFEIDLMDLPKSGEKMINEEMFLSILSLVDSKESYRALALRQAQESLERMEEMHDLDEQLITEINVEDNNGEEVENEEEDETSWIEEDPKKIVTLHFSQGYQDD
ncbi:hypothetical protein WA026_009641 [Henosepilachna vigintioctopunctata]|uniref:Tetratricopeptide repeat protein 29 n=1 Tax=Henosepilachna vigintioctopunctata TaxID=420089 RepID=A0AAW1TYW8_9CUCU